MSALEGNLGALDFLRAGQPRLDQMSFGATATYADEEDRRMTVIVVRALSR